MNLLLNALMIIHFSTNICRPNEQNKRRDPSAPTGCGREAEVVFILDASSSIWGPDFRRQKGFIDSMIQDLQVDPETIRCGLITYGDYAKVQFGLNTHSSSSSISKAITRVIQQRGNTRTDLALRQLRKLMGEEGRVGVPRIAVVITDGGSFYPSATAAEAEMVHRDGIAVFVVGVGHDLDELELRTIASDEEFVFLMSSQKEMESMRRYLVQRICSQAERPQDDEWQPLADCSNTKLDITFAIHLSTGHLPDSLNLSRRFIKNCISLLPVSTDGDTDVRVSVITFGDVTQVQFELDDYVDMTSLKSAVSRIPFRGSVSDLSGALRLMGSEERHHRMGAVRVAVVVTEGRVESPVEATTLATVLKEDLGVMVFVVGVGPGVDRGELESVASSPSDKSLFLADSYRDLRFVVLDLMERICAVGKSSSTPSGSKIEISTTGFEHENRSSSPSTTGGFSTSSQPLVSSGEIKTSSGFGYYSEPTTKESTEVRTAKASTNVLTTAMPYTSRDNWPFITAVTRGRTPEIWTDCQSVKPADILFALPSGLNSENTNSALRFLALTSTEMHLDGFNVRMGLTPRQCSPSMEGLILELGSDPDQLMAAIDSQKLKPEDLNNSTVSNLRYLREIGFSRGEIQDNYGAVLVAVVVFEPQLGHPNDQAMKEASLLKDHNVKVIGVAVGGGKTDKNNNDLVKLTSCQNCLLYSDSYSTLDESVVEKLAKRIDEYRCVFHEIPIY